MKLSEFDFRVWSKELCGNKDCKCNGFTYGKQALSALYAGLPEGAEIELWSGLVDKNGNRVYSNDIVRVLDKGEEYAGIVVYENCTWLFDFGEYKDDLGFVTHFSATEFEVIGNIHENPELLESVGGEK
ncbi:hypothetical protein CQA49_06745 [Helicobacter sp. MIT 00-7814]|uniref:YopX family protein n=1 Tax=unclassified Helicobacter TaxID=2593540 RepID=UPI000E1E4D43|nr:MULTISPECIES: YopX family protein [unclassified Helicobacter]RDU53341.1 hypothetical protein CQA49_06745 [Helicobacter sp. MIT 00-7814]RDU54162.1 hypothetical protein CQA37_05985 [Helicobacter sp. MIT 99-10781]